MWWQVLGIVAHIGLAGLDSFTDCFLGKLSQSVVWALYAALPLLAKKRYRVVDAQCIACEVLTVHRETHLEKNMATRATDILVRRLELAINDGHP